jgi:hypothetical protein
MATRQAKILIVLLVVENACQARESRTSDSTPAAKGVESERVVIPQTSVDSTPVAVIRRYYASIQSRKYDDAYTLWSDSGRASGKTALEFAQGFSGTGSVSVSVGHTVRIEGAAGSQYATVPVIVDAVLASGKRQHFVGTYTLRRAMVDGASREQRQWRIYSAHLHQQ